MTDQPPPSAAASAAAASAAGPSASLADPAADGGTDGRSAAYAEIDRLARELVPALGAALSASGLAELEVREDGWRVRLRRGAEHGPSSEDESGAHRRRVADRLGRGAGHVAGHAAPHARADEAILISTNGASAPSGGHGAHGGEPRREAHRVAATSPAVGVFRPGRDVRPGTRVRHGDSLGIVDVLGVAQEVVAPADGIVAATLVEGGQPVEYGQLLIEVERATQSGPGASDAAGEG